MHAESSVEGSELFFFTRYAINDHKENTQLGKIPLMVLNLLTCKTRHKREYWNSHMEATRTRIFEDYFRNPRTLRLRQKL
jgi:hypothetical protein